jgi:predicted NBD/HSP70 family sugar kinase
MKGKADHALLKSLNRATLLRLIRQHPGLSKAMLARHSTLTRSTVGALVQELVSEGWVREGNSEINGVGRPFVPLFVDESRLVLLGSEIGVDYLNTVAVNLAGQVLHRHYLPFDTKAHDPEHAILRLANVLEPLAHRLGAEGRQVLGTGVGLPGLVKPASGVLTVAPNLGWKNLPVLECLTDYLPSFSLAGTQLHLLNEANAGAMSEYVFGKHTTGESLLYLSLGIGVGGGIVLNDQLHVGERGYAGEIGHTTLHPDGPSCACGNQGCAEALLSQRALSRHLFPDEPGQASINDILRAVQANGEETRRVIRTTGRYLGMLIANLISTFNTHRVVIGGPVAELDQALLEPALAEVQRRTLKQLLQGISIQRCTYGRDACAVGAAAYVLHTFLTPTRNLAPHDDALLRTLARASD